MEFNQDSLDVRLILKPYILPKKSAAGLDLSAVSDRSQAVNTDRGEIVMIGPMAWYDRPVKPNLQPGDKVYYAKYGAKVLKDGVSGDLYVLVNDEDILVSYKGENQDG
jgi:co-chaperonin GroES (HSP10)